MLSRAARIARKGAAIRGIPAVRQLSAAPKAEEPAMTRVYGGLKDQDRIFTNLYGEGVSVERVFEAASWCGTGVLSGSCCLHFGVRVCAAI